MKRILILLLAALYSVMAFSQEDEPPSKIEIAFNAKYPKANMVYWYTEDNNYKIEFEIVSDTYTATFSEDGKWIETAKIISDLNMPVTVVNAIKNKYPSCDISFVEYIENGQAEKFYRILCYTEDADYKINVTEDGTILSSENTATIYEYNEE